MHRAGGIWAVLVVGGATAAVTGTWASDASVIFAPAGPQIAAVRCKLSQHGHAFHARCAAAGLIDATSSTAS